MTKRIAFQIIIICIIGTMTGFQLSAQVGFEIQNRESNIYVRSLHIDEIIVTSFGFRVQYRRSNGRIAFADLPISWFGSAAADGTVIYSHSAAVPFMNVVFIEGAASHVNLYLPRNRFHRAYRPVDQTINWREVFDGIETIELNY